MITFKQFLVEDVSDEAREQLMIKWAHQIVTDCRPALNTFLDLGEYKLYRGMTERNTVYKDEDLQPVEMLTQRRPRDTGEMVHQAMDQWFYENFGIKYRSQAISCTSDYYDAVEYGTPHLIFPIGKFRYIWSPDANDVGVKVDGKTIGRMDGPIAHYNQEDVYKIVSDILEDMTFWESKPDQAMDSGNEIMVHTKHYYAINAPHQYKKKFSYIIEKVMRGQL